MRDFVEGLVGGLLAGFGIGLIIITYTGNKRIEDMLQEAAQAGAGKYIVSETTGATAWVWTPCEHKESE